MFFAFIELYFPGPYDSPVCVFAYWVAVIVSVLLLNNKAIGRKPSVNLFKRGEILWFVVFVLSGGAIAVCIKFLISCVTFWTTKANALNQVFIQIYLLTQKYPVTIFGPAFRVLVTGLVPVAYLNFYPVVFLLGKPDAPPWMCMLAPVVATALAGVSALARREGLRKYNSCGG